jgi:hypothetical protein
MGHGGVLMKGFSIELQCPDQGFERYTVKVTRRFNIPSDEIKPCFRTRPAYELSGVLVGRDVDEARVQSYIIDYLRERGLYERLIRFKPV